MAIALMCFYPTIPWSASWKPIVTLYPIYPLTLFLVLKYIRFIFRAVLKRYYGIVVLLPGVIICWSLLSPVLYEASAGPAFTLVTTPNYQRGLLSLAVLLLLPAVLQNRNDIEEFIRSSAQLFILIHCVVIVVAMFFVLSGHPVNRLHLMRVLDTPPIYWESGLLLLALAYLFVVRKMGAPVLIGFAIIGIAGLILGGSRTRFVVTFICLLYFMYPYISIRLTAFVFSFCIVLLMVVLIVPGSAKNYFSLIIGERIEQSVVADISDPKEIERLTSRRTVAYETAFERWRQKPLFGVGSCYILPRDKAVVNGQKSMPRVHDYLLEVLAGQGWAGFSLLLAVLAVTFKNLWKINRFKAREVIDGRLLVAFFGFGFLNWLFKESWGMTYSAIILLSAYVRVWSDHCAYKSFR